MKTYTDSDLLLQGISFPLSSRPSLQMNHVDGPLLVFRDGQMHWLTPWERLLVALGKADAESLERKHRPNLMRAVKSRFVDSGYD